MKKFFGVGVCILLVVGASAFADPVTKVVFEMGAYGVNADFVSTGNINNCGTLTWTDGAIAAIYTSDPMNPVQTFFPVVNAAFTSGTDTSSGTLASAIFGHLDFTVNLYLSQGGAYVGSLTGTLYNSFKYVEKEIYEGTVLDGAAVVTLTSFNVSGYNWSEGIGQPTGLRSQTSLSTSINNYLSNWSSENTTITILADESGIPEPATIAILSLGGLLLRRKK